MDQLCIVAYTYMLDGTGWSVAVDGEVAVVGCYGSSTLSGQVAFFERNPRNGDTSAPGDQQFGSSWPLMATRVATSCSDPPTCLTQTDESAAGDFFGYSVDVSGWSAIVGAFGGGSSAGAAYIFERTWNGVFANTQSSLWQVSKKLVPPDSSSGFYFGFSVSLDGSYALITANKEVGGRAYLFGRNYGGLNNWGYIKALAAPSSSINTAGQVHLLNYWSDSKGDLQNGALTDHLTPQYEDYSVTSTTVSSNFGAGAAISGGTVAIASPYADTAGQDTGEVILTMIKPTRRQSRKKIVEQTISASDVQSGDKYGSSSNCVAYICSPCFFRLVTYNCVP